MANLDEEVKALRSCYREKVGLTVTRIRSVLDVGRNKWHDFRHASHKWLHEGHSVAHLAYFGGVFWEGHGFYASMGGLLLLMGIAMMILGSGDVE